MNGNIENERAPSEPNVRKTEPNRAAELLVLERDIQRADRALAHIGGNPNTRFDSSTETLIENLIANANYALVVVRAENERKAADQGSVKHDPANPAVGSVWRCTAEGYSGERVVIMEPVDPATGELHVHQLGGVGDGCCAVLAHLDGYEWVGSVPLAWVEKQLRGRNFEDFLKRVTAAVSAIPDAGAGAHAPAKSPEGPMKFSVETEAKPDFIGRLFHSVLDAFKGSSSTISAFQDALAQELIGSHWRPKGTLSELVLRSAEKDSRGARFFRAEWIAGPSAGVAVIMYPQDMMPLVRVTEAKSETSESPRG